MTMTMPDVAPAAVPERWVAVQARLLPDEVVEARRVRRLRRRVFVALLALAALLVLWAAAAMAQTAAAHGSLSKARRTAAQLTAQQNSFGDLIAMQAQIAQTKAQLQKLMALDVPWAGVVDALRKAPAGVTVTDVTASVTDPTGRTSTDQGAGVLDTSGKQHIGTIAVRGIAKDKRGVAAYLDALAQVPGLVIPFPAAVNADEHGYTFTADVVVTSDALGGRFSTGGTR